MVQSLDLVGAGANTGLNARLRSPLNSGQAQMGLAPNAILLPAPGRSLGSTRVSMVSSKEGVLVRGPFATFGKMLQLSAMVSSKAEGCSNMEYPYRMP